MSAKDASKTVRKVKSVSGRVNDAAMVAISLVLGVCLIVIEIGLWVNILPILGGASGFEFGVAVFVISVNGVFVPGVIASVAVVELIDRAKRSKAVRSERSVSCPLTVGNV